MIQYHDKEWGVPVHTDQTLFEHLSLDAFQAGLSWWIILNKRLNFRKAFHNFDPQKVANFSPSDVMRLLQDEGIVRNRLKIKATIANARIFLHVQKEFGSFDEYIWRFVDNKPIINHWKQMKDIPSRSRESDQMSKDLKQLGFKFVGSTICYAFMQAAGLVNDHLVNCYRYREVQTISQK